MKNEKYLKHLRFITLVAIIPLLYHACTQNEINQPLASKHFFQASDFMINDYKAQRSSKQLMKIVTINQHLDTLYYRDSLKEDELILLSKFNLKIPIGYSNTKQIPLLEFMVSRIDTPIRLSMTN